MVITKNNTYNQFLADIPPCATVSPGDSFTLETLDALFGRAADIRDKKLSQGYCRTHANPVTGPVYVSGALPGDTLEIAIHDIRLIGSGMLNVPNSGVPTESTYNGYEYVEVEALDSGRLKVFYNQKIYPARPMIGVIGTAASIDSAEEWFSVEAGDHGGNMDNNAITAGVTVYLPVFAEGALFGIGDVHAVMGDGEVFGQGVEICAEIDVTVNLRKDLKINRPFVIGAEFISSAASAANMETAGEMATADLKSLLENYYGLLPLDAALAIAFYGNLKVCQVVNKQKTMRMEINKNMLNLFQL